MADTLLGVPLLSFTTSGQAVQVEPQYAMRMRAMRLDSASMPAFTKDEDIQWRDLAPVTRTPPAAARILVTNAFLLFFCCALLWILARAKLLPPHAPAVAALIWAVSLTRFA
jgi:hypothetical protein